MLTFLLIVLLRPHHLIEFHFSEINRTKIGIQSLNEIAGSTKDVKKNFLSNLMSQNGELVKVVVLSA